MTTALEQRIDPVVDEGPPAVPEDLDRRSRWDDASVADAGFQVVDRDLVSVGAGLASFALVDTLRIAGVDAGRLAVVGPEADPCANYRRLAENSQIPGHERLRSDAGSTMDNIWGWPSYATREAWGDRSLAPLMRVLGEPVFAEFFTPRARQVYASVEREADRIGWSKMLHPGWVRTVRRRAGGGYYVLSTCPPDADRAAARVALRSRHLHLGLGYPGVALLPELARVRHQWPEVGHRIVNAYEPHEHVYDEVAARDATVLVRGSGIVASRVLQRLMDDRAAGAPVRVVHLFRNYVAGPQGRRPWRRRPGGNGFAHQAFNYPKASWGGQLKEHLERLHHDDRALLLDRLGGTNTAPRRRWKRQLRLASAEGAYQQLVGRVTDLRPAERGLAVHVSTSDGPTSFEVSHVIDATGLIADMSEHRVLSDVVAHGGAGRNPKGRLDVDEWFEVVGAGSEPGRMFASGAMTLGGPYAGVDSFLGLQYAALRIADRLAADGWCDQLGPRRSAAGWWRWMRDREPT